MLIGKLYFLNPVTGEEVPLFDNNAKDSPVVDLGPMPWGAPIVFKYEVYEHAWGREKPPGTVRTEIVSSGFPRYTRSEERRGGSGGAHRGSSKP